jgi:release factor glutamine methyltransferase
MFNIIVSNPPYIRQSEAADMLDNVTRFEPHTALFVPDNDALLFYRAIADFAVLHLHPGGQLFLEINESLGAEVSNMLASKGLIEIELKKDMQGKDRMVKARYNPSSKTPKGAL